jgi:IS5 family transposase
MSRVATPQVSFADLEFTQQGIFLDPVLLTISNFLDQHEEIIAQVRSDLERGLKNPATGRNGLTPSQVLRSLVLMRVKSWDLRELSERIADGYTLRHFTDFRSQPVPKHNAFHRAFNRLTPKTLHAAFPAELRPAPHSGTFVRKIFRITARSSRGHIQHPSLRHPHEGRKTLSTKPTNRSLQRIMRQPREQRKLLPDAGDDRGGAVS